MLKVVDDQGKVLMEVGGEEKSPALSGALGDILKFPTTRYDFERQTEGGWTITGVGMPTTATRTFTVPVQRVRPYQALREEMRATVRDMRTRLDAATPLRRYFEEPEYVEAHEQANHDDGDDECPF